MFVFLRTVAVFFCCRGTHSRDMSELQTLVALNYPRQGKSCLICVDPTVSEIDAFGSNTFILYFRRQFFFDKSERSPCAVVRQSRGTCIWVVFFELVMQFTFSDTRISFHILRNIFENQ